MSRARDFGAELATARLRLCLPVRRHAPALAEFHRRNAAHLRRWSPPAPAGVADAPYWQAKVAEWQRLRRTGASLRWLLFEPAAPSLLVGSVSLGPVERGPLQSARLGYQIDAAHEGCGLTTEALLAVVGYAFDALRLHRLEANHRPENERSARVLARLGFARIGLAPNYLFIDGAWRDHVLNQLLNPGGEPV